MATGGRAWGGDRARAGAGGAGGGCVGAMAERGPAFCGLYDTSSLLQYCNGEDTPPHTHPQVLVLWALILAAPQARQMLSIAFQLSIFAPG